MRCRLRAYASSVLLVAELAVLPSCRVHAAPAAPEAAVRDTHMQTNGRPSDSSHLSGASVAALGGALPLTAVDHRRPDEVIAKKEKKLFDDLTVRSKSRDHGQFEVSERRFFVVTLGTD